MCHTTNSVNHSQPNWSHSLVRGMEDIYESAVSPWFLFATVSAVQVLQLNSPAIFAMISEVQILQITVQQSSQRYLKCKFYSYTAQKSSKRYPKRKFNSKTLKSNLPKIEIKKLKLKWNSSSSDALERFYKCMMYC